MDRALSTAQYVDVKLNKDLFSITSAKKELPKIAAVFRNCLDFNCTSSNCVLFCKIPQAVNTFSQVGNASEVI